MTGDHDDGGPGWETVRRFLGAPGTLGPGAPERIETHTAILHLSGARAWKLRRPVDYGFLDYATRARRREMAEREIAWNAETAPGLYLGLGGVASGPRLVGPGEDVPASAEPLVVMARFGQDALLSGMAEAGRLDAEIAARAGRAAAALHRSEAPVGPAPAPADLVAPEARALRDLAGDGTLGPEAEALAAALEAEAGRAAVGRASAGRLARRCHGDLHLGNMVLWQGAPVPFDRIEFNEDLARIDPLYDLAFLTMDLRFHGLGPLAPACLAHWAEALAAEPGADVATGHDGLALLPLFEALRAAIRAKIDALSAGAASDHGAEALTRAARHVALGREILDTRPAARLVAVGGRSGTGKSTLARALAAATGALHIRSDGVRKGLAGVAPEARLPPEAYTPETSARVYGAMAERAARALAAGWPVILDAAHLDPAERRGAERIAETAGVGFDGLWLEAPGETLAARAEARRGDASDADAPVVRAQLARATGEIGWRRLDAGAPAGAVAEAARRALGLGEGD